MKYEVTREIEEFLPPETFDARPLDFEWVEATNAVLFASAMNHTTFSRWKSDLSKYYRLRLRGGFDLNIESFEDVECMSFWLTHTPNVDVHVARCQQPESVEELNSWIGSTLLESMAANERAATVGLVRIRPE
ncbi:MAG: hypothetical protein AAF989_02970 [Planctomycetota bacterium]